VCWILPRGELGWGGNEARCRCKGGERQGVWQCRRDAVEAAHEALELLLGVHGAEVGAKRPVQEHADGPRDRHEEEPGGVGGWQSGGCAKVQWEAACTESVV
jgi:hypothetical protein